MITFPITNKKWTQPNIGDSIGDIWASMNIDLTENYGKVRLGKRLILTNQPNDALPSYPVGFRVYNSAGKKVFTIAGSSGTGYVYKNSTARPSSGFSKDTLSGSPANCDSTKSDIEYLNNYLYVTTASNSVYRLDYTTWTNFTVGGSDSANAHMLCAYLDRMYMTRDSTKIYSFVDTGTPVVATSGSYTLQLGDSTQNVITFIRAASNRIWIGVLNQNGGKGYIAEWDGVSTQVTKSYRLESSGALACVIKDDIPYVMDTNGVLIAWNGGTFKEVARLNRKNNKLLWNPYTDTNTRFIHPNGMSILNGRLNLLFDGTNFDTGDHTGTQEETIPSGIYEYVEGQGLFHKHSIATATSSGTIQDYGHSRVYGVGGIAEITTDASYTTANGRFNCGVTYFSDATTKVSGIFYDDLNDTKQKYGYFITSKIESQGDKSGPGITNAWNNIFNVYKRFLSSDDKMWIKYRVNEAEPVVATITWTSTTTFTTTTDISSYWTSGTGGEVEIVQGIGAGKCSHITSIVNNSGSYLVTVDETYTGATGTAKARFQSWKKIGTSSGQLTNFDQSGIGDVTTWIQFKICMQFTGRDELEKLIISNNSFQKA